MPDKDHAGQLSVPQDSINVSEDEIRHYHLPNVLSSSEISILTDSKQYSNIQTYKRRWYILIMFGVYAFSQNLVWNTWGPITVSSESAFNWDDANIALLANWGPVTYILTGLFLPWLLQVKGLRWATLSSVFLVAAGSSFRVITSQPQAATILIHIGQFLNGVAGPIAMGGIPTLSATWFPPHERVTATAIGTSISSMGSALAFVLGPLFVSSPPGKNLTNSSNVSFFEGDAFMTTTEQPNGTDVSREREEIMNYMYYQCGWSVLVFLIILCYFPARPPNPPCVSATSERDKYWPGLWSLRKKSAFLIVGLTYGVSNGVLNGWLAVITINLKGHLSETTAGWIGFYSTVGSCVVSMIVGRFADWFARYIKIFILIMYILGTVFLIVFTLILIDVIPYSDVYIYITVIAAVVLLNAAVPMFYELACELAYPTSEGAANGLLTYFNNFWGLVFLAIFSFKNVGTMWMNWAFIGANVVCIPLIFVLKGRFKRLEVDTGLNKVTDQQILVKED